MAGLRIEGNTSGYVAEVNAANQLKVTAETDVAANPGNVGSVRFFSENDAGSAMPSAHLVSPETSQDYRLRVGTDTILFSDGFTPTSQNTAMWKHGFITMTMTQAAGFLNVNAAGTSTVATNYAYLQSWKYFTLTASSPFCMETVLQFDKVLVANEVFQWGFGVPTGVVDPVDGAWFELTTTNGLVGCVRSNSGAVVRTTTMIASAAIPLNTTSKYFVIYGNREVEFWIDDVLYGSIPTPATNGNPAYYPSFPIFYQKYNNGVIGTSPNAIMKVSYVNVTLMDANTNKPWAHQQTGYGAHSSQGQSGHASLISTALAVSANPGAAAAVVQATAAATFVGLGGIARVLPTLVSGTEGILFSYLNPASTVAIPGRTLYITGVKLYSTVEVALTGGPLINVLQLVYGHTAISLAVTADSASFTNTTVKCPRRIPLGMEVFAAAAAIGTVPNGGNGLSLDLSTSPIAINPGEYVGIGLRNQGTVTTLGNTLYAVTFTGYWE